MDIGILSLLLHLVKLGEISSFRVTKERIYIIIKK